jgi:hypothetical protein
LLYRVLTGTVRIILFLSVVGSEESSAKPHDQSHSQLPNTSALPATMMCLQERYDYVKYECLKQRRKKVGGESGRKKLKG